MMLGFLEKLKANKKFGNQQLNVHQQSKFSRHINPRDRSKANSILRLSQYRSNLSESAAADDRARLYERVLRENSIFRLPKRCLKSEGYALEK